MSAITGTATKFVSTGQLVPPADHLSARVRVSRMAAERALVTTGIPAASMRSWSSVGVPVEGHLLDAWVVDR